MITKVGFYKGFAEIWIKKVESGDFFDRTKVKLASFQDEVLAFSMENDSDPDPNLLLERLRGKFKVLQSLLGSSQSYTPAKSAKSQMNF
jgi:hypothetical protein